MLKVLPILALVLVLTTLGLFASPLFKIKSLEVKTDNRCVSQSFVQNAGIIGQNLITFSPADLKSLIKNKYGCVQEMNVEKDFPNTLKVSITTALPLAKIDGTDFLISSQNIITSGSAEGLPVVFLPNKIPLKVGNPVKDQQLLFVSNVLNQLKDTDFIVSSVRVIDPGNIIVYNRENALVIFSSQQDFLGQISSLQQVIAKSKIDATKIQKIDLRFDKPTIVFK